MSDSDESLAVKALVDALTREDADGVERALSYVYEKPSPAFVPVLIRLLGAPWHQRHEDVVSVLQELKDRRAVDALFEAAFARHEYLMVYDEFFGLARKCTWALADIGTDDARAKLSVLAAGENAIIAGYARKRLDHWDQEKERKAG